ncbi:MAG: NCS2 family permease [Mucispirillum sp.]|uniref:NCS2 family permease n=1 Tax=Candidatus Mucispirillum faecigallinarum TaxID=2838699 RepID=A0A9D2GVL4_9BACT|nr:NCS2 family permease [Mucispirillum sp.]HIZ89786.1 NCS2 family permease [Candidatus Mucispirillum faecigallinarum]
MLDKIFHITSSKSTVKNEIIAGFTTFMTMSYIIFVNPDILSNAGMPKDALITATCLAAAFASILMGLYANYPIGLATSMTSNVFFAFVIVKSMGLSWQQGLAAVFIVGVLFIFITIGRIRELIMDAIPLSLKMGIPAGIGIFLMFIGMQSAGIIINQDETLVTYGSLKDADTLLAVFGLMLMIILHIRKVTGAILISIAVITIISIPLGLTKLPSGIISAPPSISPVFLKMDFSKILDADFLMAVFTLLFMAVFDTIGTLMGVAQRAGLVDENGKMMRSKKAFMADAAGSTAGSIFGVSTVGAYIESVTGVESGGRTGLTAVVIGILFLLAMFFSPLIQIVPAAATAPALIFVGILMFSIVEKINFSDWTELTPAVIAVVMIPLTYNIAAGIEYSILAYVIIKAGTGRYKEISKTMFVLSIIFILKEIFV